MRRNFLKIAATSLFGLLIYPLNSLANNLVGFKKKLKKDESEYNIINPDLTEEQKIIMFEEGTERAGTSELNYEKRKGSYHCANCGAKLFESTAKLTVELVGPHSLRQYQEFL